MLCEKKSFPLCGLNVFARDFMTEDMLLFDIETTGLSPARDAVYCIGCSYLTGGEVVIELFFGEDTGDEDAVFSAFMPVLASHSTVITFNGTTFDIPFLKKRYPDFAPVFDEKESLDLYRVARGMKPLLRLDSYKQKSIEKFLGIDREDVYGGGELVAFYLEYTLHRDPEKLRFLLLHNFEDVKGMYELLGLLAYRQLTGDGIALTETMVTTDADDGGAFLSESSVAADADTGRPTLAVRFWLRHPLPQGIRLSTDEAELTLDGCTGNIRFPIYHDSLKHFFNDCENYWYLPDEDVAVHKSVGDFVDPSHRRKATPKTCYVKKECDYIALPHATTPCYLRKDYSDRRLILPLPAKDEEILSFIKHYFS